MSSPLAICVIGDVEQFVGVRRHVVDATTLSAHVALLIDAWQRRGLGRPLLATFAAS